MNGRTPSGLLCSGLLLLFVSVPGCSDGSQPGADSGLASDAARGDATSVDDALSRGEARAEATAGDQSRADGSRPDLVPHHEGATPPLTNDRCASPKTIPLVNGRATEVGSTTGAKNEFGMVLCSGALVDYMRGPQVYYRVTLEAGQKYMMRVVSDFDSTFYAFPASTSCTEAAIDKACKGPSGDEYNIWNSDEVIASGGELIRISPATTSDWILVVDSFLATEAGSFTLTIAPISPPANQSCAQAKPLVLTGAKTVEQGDTSVALNELPKSISCGLYQNYFFDGPQLYYKMTAAEGKAYRISLTATFTAHLYVFSAASCQAVAINQSCGSFGLSGDKIESIGANTTEAILFYPQSGGDYVIAIDSPKRTWSGPFQLTIEDYAAPGNSRCASPQVVTLASNPTVIQASTTGAPNEFGNQLTCTKPKALTASQLYYQLSLLAGKTYTITALPVDIWDVALYAFTGKTCSASSINSQCASFYSDAAGKLMKETLTITPSTNADYVIGVDSISSSQSGQFSLSVGWK